MIWYSPRKIIWLNVTTLMLSKNFDRFFFHRNFRIIKDRLLKTKILDADDYPNKNDVEGLLRQPLNLIQCPIDWSKTYIFTRNHSFSLINRLFTKSWSLVYDIRLKIDLYDRKTSKWKFYIPIKDHCVIPKEVVLVQHYTKLKTFTRQIWLGAE